MIEKSKTDGQDVEKEGNYRTPVVLGRFIQLHSERESTTGKRMERKKKKKRDEEAKKKRREGNRGGPSRDAKESCAAGRSFNELSA